MALWFTKKGREQKRLKFEEQRLAAERERVAALPRPKVGLALSGGGAKGYAHLGVLKAFEENGVDFDVVAGTSVGSLIGALYAYGLPTEKIIEAGADLEIKDIRDHSFLLNPSNPANIEAVVRGLIGDVLFSDLKKPFSAVATDLKSGREIVLNMGGVARAVSASCCVPVVFKPVVWGDWHLVDGGLVNVLPADVARAMGADKVVAVDINSARGSGTDSVKLWDVVKASFRIAMGASSKFGMLRADLAILPDTKRFRSSKKEGYEEMIETGYQAALEVIPQVKALFERE
ncbi:MAG: patatin-like phospholipase family protein [Clostridiales bacterium]|jgi:NTE family protein|nr:patatin-like phospholipase family protein [Clostridiales bacterium]